MMRSVAMVGIGAMGRPMAHRIVSAGLQLTVCDASLAAVEPLAKDGVHIALNPADCAGAEVVLVMVSTAQQVCDVILGDRGILVGLTGQQSPMIVVMSTVSAGTLDKIAKQLPPSVRLIDAPVSGGVSGAEQGTLTMLTGGDEHDVQLLEPLFQILASTRIHCGNLGSAQTMKILNNTIGVTIAVVAGEVYRIAIEHGLNPASVSQVLEACSGRNIHSKDPAGPRAGYEYLVRDRAVYDGIQAIIRKDLGLARDLASATVGQYPAIQGLKSLVDTLGNETFSNWCRIADLSTESGENR